MRAMSYLNQFFAGIGGEDKARSPVAVFEHAVGAARLLAELLGRRGSVLATVMCGDDYFSENTEDAVARVVAEIEKRKPDVVVAGPAFNAGRYGFACARVLKEVSERLGVPGVTAMYPDNPAVALCLGAPRVWIFESGDNASDMPRAMRRLAESSLKIAERGSVSSAEAEGYIPTGLRELVPCERSGAERAVEMLLRKLHGEPFKTEIPVHEVAQVRPAVLRKPLKQSRVGLITTSGLVPRGNPDRFRMFNATRWGKYELPPTRRFSPDEWQFVHGGFNTAYAEQDAGLVLPIDVLAELQGRFFDELYPWFYSMTGVGTGLKFAAAAGAEIADDMRNSGVDAALLVAT